MRVAALDPCDAAARARYDRLIAACPHAFIQQTSLWADLIGDLGPDRPIFLVAEDGDRDVGALPLYLFEGTAGALLTSVPQAGPLGGVLLRRGVEPDPVYETLLGEAVGMARAQNCLALTIISNPVEDDVELYRRHMAPNVEFENFTQIVPLANAVREGRLIVPNNKKNNPAATIKKAEAAGLTARLGTTTAEFEAWYAIHAERAATIGVAALDRRLVERIWRDLGAGGHAFLQLVMHGEDIAAGCLFALHHDVCDVFAISMESRFAEIAPNYLAFKAAMIEMAARGVSIMNWQSSPVRGDGVYRFKRQWASIERPYYFMTRTFCSDETILALGPEGCKRHFPGHYVVPFGVFEAGRVAGRFAKR
jgi:hypothetical protein